MKTLLRFLFILLVLLPACTGKDQEKTTRLYHFTPYQDMPEILTGKVKSVTELNYWAIEKDGSFEPGLLVTTKERDSLYWSNDFTATFNEWGNIERCDYFNADQQAGSWVIENDQTQYKKAGWYENDTLKVSALFLYDQNGLLTEAKAFRNDTLWYRNEASYDDKGNIIESRNYNPSGELTRKYVITWNELSLATGRKVYNASDSLLSGGRAEYNDKGFYTRVELLDGKGEIASTITGKYLSYDKKGNWLTGIFQIDNHQPFYIIRSYTYF